MAKADQGEFLEAFTYLVSWSGRRLVWCMGFCGGLGGGMSSLSACAK
jgi:hypothetical protein